MRTLMLGLAGAAMIAFPVLAQEQACPQQLQTFDQAVAGTSADADTVTAAKQLRASGEEKMKQGDDAGCVADLTRANQMIGASAPESD